MKKVLFFTGIMFLTVAQAVSFAQMPVSMPAVSVTAGLEKAGVVAAAKGKIELRTPGQAGRIAESGQPVFIGDEVSTDAQGHLQILLLDQTVFTIGPNSTFLIDEFVYDPKTQNGKIKASVTKGVFRYVSGKIAAKKPDHVSVKLPTATIGFRGTIVAGQVNPDNSSLAALLGPGDNNNAGARIGSFVMEGNGDNSGDQQEVNRTGFGVTAGADGDLSGVFQLSEEQINNLTSGLLPSGDEGSGEDDTPLNDDSATDASGETTALTDENGDMVTGLTDLTDDNSDTSTTAAQDAADETTAISTGVTKMEELSRIETGKYYFFGSGPFNYNEPGFSGMSLVGQCEIDFGSKMIGGPDSWVKILDSEGVVFDETTGVGNVDPLPFGSSGPATFQWNNVEGNFGTFTNIDVTLKNIGGEIAAGANVAVKYENGPYSGDGAGEAVRIPVPVDPETVGVGPI